MCFDFFESRLKRKLGKHWRESWLTSTRYFEVLVVKLTQTLFLNIILRKILRKKSKKRKIFENFFVVIWVVLCVQNINNWFGAFLWHNNCRKCRNHHTLKLAGTDSSSNEVVYFIREMRRVYKTPTKKNIRKRPGDACDCRIL